MQKPETCGEKTASSRAARVGDGRGDSCAEVEPFQLDRGIGFYLSPGNQENLKRKLEDFNRCGVMFAGTDGFMQWRDSQYCTEIARIFAAFAIQCETVHAPFGLGFVSESRHMDCRADNRRLIDIAEEWGARAVVYHFRTPRSTVGDTHFLSQRENAMLSKDDLDRISEKELVPLCEYAAARHIQVNLENLPLVSWAADPHEIFAFIRKMNLPNLGWLYDIGHANCSGLDPVAVLEDGADLLNDTHFHDNLGQGKIWKDHFPEGADIAAFDLHLPPGLGTIPWVRVNLALRKHRYAHRVMFEGCNDPAAILLTQMLWQRASEEARKIYNKEVR